MKEKVEEMKKFSFFKGPGFTVAAMIATQAIAKARSHLFSLSLENIVNPPLKNDVGF